MVSTQRISEAYRFYVFSEPSNEPKSIERYFKLRERLRKILNAEKYRSIQLAMGSNSLPFQNIIADMSDKDFEEFIDGNIIGKRRKEIYNKYLN